MPIMALLVCQMAEGMTMGVNIRIIRLDNGKVYELPFDPVNPDECDFWKSAFAHLSKEDFLYFVKRRLSDRFCARRNWAKKRRRFLFLVANGEAFDYPSTQRRTSQRWVRGICLEEMDFGVVQQKSKVEEEPQKIKKEEKSQEKAQYLRGLFPNSLNRCLLEGDFIEAPSFKDEASRKSANRFNQIVYLASLHRGFRPDSFLTIAQGVMSDFRIYSSNEWLKKLSYQKRKADLDCPTFYDDFASLPYETRTNEINIAIDCAVYFLKPFQK